MDWLLQVDRVRRFVTKVRETRTPQRAQPLTQLFTDSKIEYYYCCYRAGLPGEEKKKIYFLVALLYRLIVMLAVFFYWCNDL